MKAIHLIQNNPELRPKPITPGSQTYESGFWWLPIERAKSFIGGGIKDCWVQQYNGQDRVVFKFEALASYKGMRPTNPDGWEGGNWVINFEE